MPEPSPLFLKVEELQRAFISTATSDPLEPVDYETLRAELLANPTVRDALPDYVHRCRNLQQFWHFIKPKFRTYQERREYIWDSFRPLLDSLERNPATPVISDQHLLAKLSAHTVQAVWQRALERRISDPEGAITSARTLIESVCKHILDDAGVQYDDNADLPKLYRETAEVLNIAPSQHSEDAFKRILGGCTSVIEGLGTLRNRVGDAHGHGHARVRPAPRHAELAVNLAGAMTSFLVATWEARKSSIT